MKKSRLGCMFLSLILALGCFAGCTETPGDTGTAAPGAHVGTETPGDEPAALNHTVTYDVGAEAKAAGVTVSPQSSVVKSGETAVRPQEGYWEGYALTGWYNGNELWDFSTAVTGDMTLTAKWEAASATNVAEKYEASLDWGEQRHLYVHYLRAAHDSGENGTVNGGYEPSTHSYDSPIDSAVYGDWGLWVWEYNPIPSEGRTFYPMKIDESGAVYDIYLDGTWNDGGWDSATRTHKDSVVNYTNTSYIGVQLFSKDSRENGQGFWVNDSGDITFRLDRARREKGDYHWFIRQNEGQSGTPTYESYIVFDPYEGLEPGSAVSTHDVTSHKGNAYDIRPVAKGWEENSVGYQIFVASFADSDDDGMGDLRGIISKLDELKEFGVDTLWLTPFQQSNSYHGYDIQDYFTVDPRFGTLEDYRELLTEAHKRGMKVLMDFVLNHTSTSNPWFVKSSKLVKETVKMGDGSLKTVDYRSFYTWQNEEYVAGLKDEAARNQWYKDSNGYYFYSSFGSSMPELNFDYQAVRDAILDVALYWMSFGLDGFRLDAAKHIYMVNENPNGSSLIVRDYSDGTAVGSTKGDYSYDVKKDANFFTEFNAKLKASYPNALLLAENFNGDPIHIAQLYEGLDSQFNFNFYYDMSGAIATVAFDSTNGKDYNSKGMQSYTAAQFDFNLYRHDYIDGIFTSNHDVTRARNRLTARRNLAKADWIEQTMTDSLYETTGKLAKLWAGVCLSMPGITWIYAGDELGMTGEKTPNPAEEGAGHEDRWLRQPYKWTSDGNTENEDGSYTYGWRDEDGKTDYTCYFPIGFNGYYSEWDQWNKRMEGLEQQKADKDSIYNAYKSIIAARKRADSPLRNGTVTIRTSTDSSDKNYNLMIWEVSDGKNTWRMFLNATSGSKTTDLAGGTLVYATSGTGFTSSVPAYTFAIYSV